MLPKTFFIVFHQFCLLIFFFYIFYGIFKIVDFLKTVVIPFILLNAIFV